VISAKYPGITEIQAGGGCFMDMTYSDRFGNVGPLQYALTIISTVVSRPAPDRAICDAGRKTMSDQMMMPQVASVSGARLYFLSAEHSTMEVAGQAAELEVGDRVEIIPGYSDTTMFLHDRIYGVRNDQVELVWPILARGRKD
jgi:D-serine deaminase-like pyridoxal phosphate-dependent protein